MLRKNDRKRTYKILSIFLILVSLTGCSKKVNYEILQSSLVEDNMSIVIRENTLTRKSVTIAITDLSGRENTFGSDYRIDKYNNDNWEELSTKQDAYWTMMGYVSKDGNPLVFDIEWDDLYGKLENGTYRIVKSYITPDKENKYISVDFTIKD